MATRARLLKLRRRPIESVWTRNRRAIAQTAAAEPPPWPALDLGVILDWDGPAPHNPPFHIIDVFTIPWDNDAGWYYGAITSGVYEVRVWFHLDLFNGNYFAYLELWKGAVNICAVSSALDTIPVGSKFDITIGEWIGLWPADQLEATFRS